MNVMLNGLDEPDEIEAIRGRLAAAHHTDIAWHNADMREPAQIAALIAATCERFGQIDVLVNNAGIQHVAPIETFPVEQCYSRCAGTAYKNHWIPACAGMTGGRNDIEGCRFVSCDPRRHSSEGWNPGERAGGVKGWRVLSDGAFGWRARVLSFPLCGNGLFKPQFGLRRAQPNRRPSPE